MSITIFAFIAVAIIGCLFVGRKGGIEVGELMEYEIEEGGEGEVF